MSGRHGQDDGQGEAGAAETRCPPRGGGRLLARASQWAAVGLLALATVLALPLLGLTRRARLPAARPEEQPGPTRW